MDEATHDLELVEYTVPDEMPDTLLSVDALEAAMHEYGPQLVIEPVHHFAPGIYAREITIPAGSLITGAIHRTAHLNIVSQGEITIWTEGEPARRIRAPFCFTAGVGARKVGFAHTDTVWTTVHPNPTDARDLELLEALFIEPHVNPLLPPPEARLVCRSS
jgi:hypothetical protein